MNDTLTILGQQVPVALVLVYLQNWVKKSSWFPWITYESQRVNNLAAIVLSGLATIGIHIAHTGTIMGGGTLTITFPSLAVLVVAGWHWLQQYILSKTAYSALQSQLNPAPKTEPKTEPKATPLVASTSLGAKP